MRNGNGREAIPRTGPVRCAIYTRKSHEEGLDQEFNSLDAQREAGEAYIASQKGEGWVLVPARYDDGGFSGGTLERPALQRLMADAEAGKVDCIMVYKVDRLTRSLMDFSKLVEAFDRNRVSFVSVTQQFNTSTSMGRLTLNMLLSFAQFEREVTAERIRDKFAALRKRGKHMGEMPVLGYDIDRARKRLVINPIEADLVRHIFQRFLNAARPAPGGRLGDLAGAHRRAAALPRGGARRSVRRASVDGRGGDGGPTRVGWVCTQVEREVVRVTAPVLDPTNRPISTSPRRCMPRRHWRGRRSSRCADWTPE